jgi:DNA repair exonuclease SbcCD nuclease subunit
MKLEGIRKIFVLGDLHLGVRNNSLEWSDIQCDFLLDFFLKKVDEDGFDPDKDILVQVGDWNHVRESTNVRIYKKSLEVAQRLTQKFKRGVYVILGNHDVYYKDRNDTHSLEGFDLMYKNFHIFTKPTPLTINSHKFLMLPWVEDVTELKQIVKANRSAEYIFCHADVQGFNLNKSTKLEHGLEYSDLKSFKRVYSGHIHIRQDKNNVLYVGTPYEMDRGDRGNVKGFYVLYTGAENELIEKFIENTVSPRHIKIEMLDLLNMNFDQIKEMFNNNFVDIMIESSFSSRFPLSTFTEMIKEAGHRRIEFFSYSKEQAKAKSEVELNSNYEYNIFTVLQEKIKESNMSPIIATQIFDRFKTIYDSLKNTKSYE